MGSGEVNGSKPTQERLGKLAAICHNFGIFCREPEMQRVCLPRACWDTKREKLFFFFFSFITGGCCETDLIVSVWRLFNFFFPKQEKENKQQQQQNISGTKQECKRDVCCVWFRRCLRKDFLSLVLWLWWEASQRPVLFFIFIFSPFLSCRNATFYLFWY